MAAGAALSEARSAARRPGPVAAHRLELIPLGHPLRRGFEQFIAERFARTYGAHVTHFLPQLVGLRDALSGWQGAAGYAAAGDAPLFLEQYLGAPVETMLASAAARPVERKQVVEVGNLAAVSAGMARALIPLLARHLYAQGFRWVAFTATREVRNSFRRMGLHPLQIVRADRACLADGGASWGRYYEREPMVMAGRIAFGLRARA